MHLSHSYLCLATVLSAAVAPAAAYAVFKPMALNTPIYDWCLTWTFPWDNYCQRGGGGTVNISNTSPPAPPACDADSYFWNGECTPRLRDKPCPDGKTLTAYSGDICRCDSPDLPAGPSSGTATACAGPNGGKHGKAVCVTAANGLSSQCQLQCDPTHVSKNGDCVFNQISPGLCLGKPMALKYKEGCVCVDETVDLTSGLSIPCSDPRSLGGDPTCSSNADKTNGACDVVCDPGYVKLDTQCVKK